MSERVYQAHANNTAACRDTAPNDVTRAHYDYANQAHQAAVLLTQHAVRLAADADKMFRTSSHYLATYPSTTTRLPDGRVMTMHQALNLAGQELRTASAAAIARAAVQHDSGLEFERFAASQMKV